VCKTGLLPHGAPLSMAGTACETTWCSPHTEPFRGVLREEGPVVYCSVHSLDYCGQSSSASLPVYFSPENEQKIYQALQISLYFCPVIAATLFPQILRVGRSQACLSPLNGRHNVLARGHYVCATSQTPPSRDCVTDGGTWPAGCTGGGRRQEVAWAPSPARPYGIPSPQAWDDCNYYAYGLQHYGTDFALGNF
jgi:hypothetical protein